MRKAEFGLVGIVVLSLLTGIAFYNHLPAEIPSHWNMAGQVNGYLSRPWGVFLLPIILLIVSLAFFIIPRIDPRRENIMRFKKYFDYFLITFGIFFYYIYLLTLLFAVGYEFDTVSLLSPAIAMLFYVIGVLLAHAETNWTIGVRTPWTMSSVKVWKKTNEAGGTAFKVCAAISLLGIVFSDAAIWFFVVPIIVSAIGLVVYSYMLYAREKRS